MRSSGKSGSTGTYAAPDFSTASSETNSSADRGSTTATNLSGPAPRSTRKRARRFARLFNSR